MEKGNLEDELDATEHKKQIPNLKILMSSSQTSLPLGCLCLSAISLSTRPGLVVLVGITFVLLLPEVLFGSSCFDMHLEANQIIKRSTVSLHCRPDRFYAIRGV